MKVIITDTQFRKAFDTTNAIRFSGYEVIPTRSKKGFWQFLKLGIGLSEKVYLLRTDSFDVFTQDLQQIIEVGNFKNEEQELALIACEEKTVELLSENKERLNALGIKSLIPGFESFQNTVDKGNLMDFCQKTGIPCPTTFLDKKTLLKEECGDQTREWVFKPRRGTGAEGVQYLDSVAVSELDESDFKGNLIQEKIPSNSGVQGGFFLCFEGEVVAHYAHERIRTYPETGGVTVLSKCTQNPELYEIGKQMLSALKWEGFAMVECIRDSRDDQLKVIEVNPRLWGSILLSEFSGARLLQNALRVLEGKTPFRLQVDFDSYIRWIFPYDVLYWWSHPSERKHFFRTDEKTCYVCKTYTSAYRSFAFQLMNVVDPGNVLKFFRRKLSRA